MILLLLVKHKEARHQITFNYRNLIKFSDYLEDAIMFTLLGTERKLIIRHASELIFSNIIESLV